MPFVPISVSIMQILLLALLVVYAISLFRSGLNPKYIKRAALTIVIAGTALHTYGFLVQTTMEQGILTIIARSFILTLKMFIYNAEVFEELAAQATPGFLELYFFIFYAAFLTSVSAIIMLFGKRAITALTLLFRRRHFKHVFIGGSSRSEMIARSLGNDEVALIEFPSDSEEDEISIQGVLKSIFARSESEGGKKSKSGSVTVLFAKRHLRLIESQKDVFASIGLERLNRFIDKDTAFYLLSENTERNLDELMALLADKRLLENTIHVCMPREGVARYYKTTLKRTGVHFIYPSSLSVVELMKVPECHPAYVMNHVKDADGLPTGAVSGNFNALVLGFGETGQAVTKFLYEFSSAIGTDGLPLPVNIYVNDEHIDSLKGPFEFTRPDISNSGIIHYENYGTESSEFWTKVMERLDSLSYIAISLHEDASSLDIACTIFMYAMKKRKGGLDNLRIVIRKKHMLTHEKELVAKMNEKAGHEVIICYGEYEKIFVPEMIVSSSSNGINSTANKLAKRIANAYSEVAGNNIDLSARHTSFHEKNRARMELHQLISRANYSGSLATILDGCEPSRLSEAALWNFARTEHLRFSRYLAAHGYSYADEDDDVMKTNRQICDWSKLTDEDRQYHLDMVKAQLKTLKQTHKSEN